MAQKICRDIAGVDGKQSHRKNVHYLHYRITLWKGLKEKNSKIKTYIKNQIEFDLETTVANMRTSVHACVRESAYFFITGNFQSKKRAILSRWCCWNSIILMRTIIHHCEQRIYVLLWTLIVQRKHFQNFSTVYCICTRCLRIKRILFAENAWKPYEKVEICKKRAKERLSARWTEKKLSN